jgi:hypothetical protein
VSGTFQDAVDQDRAQVEQGDARTGSQVMAESVVERDRAVRADLLAGQPVEVVARRHALPADVAHRIAIIAGVGGSAAEGGEPIHQPDAAYKPGAEAAAVLNRIGWHIPDHVASPARCTRRDAALCDSIILEDLTLDETGARADVTRERMRQVLQKHTGLSTRDLAEHRGQLREARRLVFGRSEVARVAAERPDASINDLAAGSGLTADEVAEVLGADETLLRRARNTWTVGLADDDVLREIRRVAALPGGTPLTGPFYDEHRGGDALGSVRIIQRFGTWREACARAQVPVRDRDRDYERRWSEDQLLDWVTAFVEEVGATRATFARFEGWLRDRRSEGAPSGQTVRNYLGKWGDILRTVAER